MSVLFLPPSAGAASVPDASETVSGKIRIATSAEATTGTNDLTAMTPAKVKTVVDAAVVGGVTYKGTFDTSAPVDLSNALQGDLYIISVAGSYQGQTWAVGDHLLINADMGGTLDPAKIDKVDNTDAVTSVAGRTGAVVLSSADISGLGTAAALDVGTGANNVVQLDGSARLPAVDGSQLINLPSGASTLGALSDVTITGVANTEVIKYNSTSGDWENSAVAYADVTGTPSLATVATSGAYSDLSGTPTLGTAAAEDVGTAAGNVVQLNGSAQLPAIDGSLLTNISASVAALDDVGDVTITTPTNTQVIKYNSTSGDWENGAVAYADVTGTPTLGTASAEDVGTAAGNVVQLNGSAQLPAVDGSLLTNVSASVAALDDVGDVTITGVSNTQVIKYNSTSGDWENGAVAYADVTGTPTLGTAAAEDVGTAAGNVVQLDGSARLPAVDGSQLTNLPSGSSTLGGLTDVTIASVANTQVIKYNSTSGDWENGAVAYSEVTGTPTLGTAAAEDVGTAAGNVVQLNGSAQLPAVDGSLLTNVSAPVAALNDVGNVDTTGQTSEDLLKYDGTNWVAAARFEVVTTVTTTTTLTVPEMEQLVRTSGAGITLNLPNIASNSIPAGVRYQVKVTDTNAVNIAPNGAELLEGVNTSYATSGAKEALTVLCDGTGWWFV